MENNIDLFEYPEQLPDNLKEVLKFLIAPWEVLNIIQTFLNNSGMNKAAINAKIEKILNAKINYVGLGIMSQKDFLIAMKKEGRKAQIEQKPSVVYNRLKYNRMTGAEQIAYDKKLNNMVPSYRLYSDININSYYEISKTEFDFFNSIIL